MRAVRPGWVGSVLAAAAWVAGAGCAAVFTPPSVRVAEVRLASLSLVGGTLQVALDVENPNRFALESREFRYALSFAEPAGGEASWIPLAEGALADTVRIEAGRTGRVTVDVPFDLSTVGAALTRLLRQGELEYRFTGALVAGTPLGSRRVPFDQRGRFRP